MTELSFEPDNEATPASAERPRVFLDDFDVPWETWDSPSSDGYILHFRALHGACYSTDVEEPCFEMTTGELRLHLQQAILEADEEDATG